MTTSLREKEFIRGKILHYLSMIYPHSATLPLLQGELDVLGYPVSMESLQFQVAYLDEKGLVAVDEVRGPHAHRNVTLVKITARGIDYCDGRLPADEGVYQEPDK